MRTLVESLAGVDHHMLCQITPSFKCLAAMRTLEGSLPSVDRHVQPQIALFLKSPVALRAPVGSFIAVNQHVSCQVTLVSEGFVALGTLVGSFIHHLRQINCLGHRKGVPPARPSSSRSVFPPRKWESFLTGVSSKMFAEHSFADRCIFAMGTMKRLLSAVNEQMFI